MSLRLVPMALALGPVLLAAQQPADSARARPDSTHPVTLQEITVTAAPVRREAPLGSVTVPGVHHPPDARAQHRRPAASDRRCRGARPGAGPWLCLGSGHPGVQLRPLDRHGAVDRWRAHQRAGQRPCGGLQRLEPPDAPGGATDRRVQGPDQCALRQLRPRRNRQRPRTLERMSGTDLSLDGGMLWRAEGAILTGFDHDRSGGVFGLRGIRESGWRPNSGYHLGQGHARVVRDLSAQTSLDAGSNCTPPAGTHRAFSPSPSSTTGSTTQWPIRPTAALSTTRRSG